MGGQARLTVRASPKSPGSGGERSFVVAAVDQNGGPGTGSLLVLRGPLGRRPLHNPTRLQHLLSSETHTYFYISVQVRDVEDSNKPRREVKNVAASRERVGIVRRVGTKPKTSPKRNEAPRTRKQILGGAAAKIGREKTITT